MRLLDITGQTFGRLSAVSRAEAPGKGTRWVCKCECGTTRTVLADHLRSGHTQSCGCMRSEMTVARNISNADHGMWKTPEFQAWASMLKRCYNLRNKKYADYGGRGITVADEWRESFSTFYAHIGARPSSSHSLDRIRNEEGYKPGNVRWATAYQQSNNRRYNVTAVINGETLTVAQIAVRYGLGHRTVSYRVKAGKSANEIIAPSSRA